MKIPSLSKLTTVTCILLALLPACGKRAEPASATSASNEEPRPIAPLSANELMNQRIVVMDKENEVAAQTAQLQTVYQQLQSARQSLDVHNAPAVTAFNKQAAEYMAQKIALDGELTKLATMQTELQKMIDAGPSERAARSPGGKGKIVMYTTSTCPACTAAKSYFKQRGISYLEMNVEANQQAMEQFAKLGGRGVPLIIINGQTVEGFNPGRIEQLLSNG